MVEKTPILDIFTYVFLMLGILVVGFPIIYAIIAATLPLDQVSRVPMPMIPGDQLLVNFREAWQRGDLGTQLMNSFIMAGGITFGKIVVSMLGAFSIVYFDYRFRTVAFVTVFCTLMLPVEVRILPTYEMAANLAGPLQPLWKFLHIDSIISWFAGHDIKVTLSDKKTYEARLVGRDEKTDLAVLKIDVDHDLPSVKLGDSGKLEVGDWVIAIGNPFGVGQTVSSGIISGLARSGRRG